MVKKGGVGGLTEVLFVCPCENLRPFSFHLSLPISSLHHPAPHFTFLSRPTISRGSSSLDYQKKKKTLVIPVTDHIRTGTNTPFLIRPTARLSCCVCFNAATRLASVTTSASYRFCSSPVSRSFIASTPVIFSFLSFCTLNYTFSHRRCSAALWLPVLASGQILMDQWESPLYYHHHHQCRHLHTTACFHPDITTEKTCPGCTLIISSFMTLRLKKERVNRVRYMTHV